MRKMQKDRIAKEFDRINTKTFQMQAERNYIPEKENVTSFQIQLTPRTEIEEKFISNTFENVGNEVILMVNKN